MKKEFIRDEVWMLTVNAAFQRANVYTENASDPDKKSFKFMLKGYIDNCLKDNNSSITEDHEHIEKIISVSEYSSNFSSILNGGRLNFGVSQKLLNLYLKYLWCLDILKTPPPHFPIDRIIQQNLGISQPVAWTQMQDETDYINIIEIARKKLSESGYTNIAELELALFSRRNN